MMESFFPAEEPLADAHRCTPIWIDDPWWAGRSETELHVPVRAPQTPLPASGPPLHCRAVNPTGPVFGSRSPAKKFFLPVFQPLQPSNPPLRGRETRGGIKHLFGKKKT